MQKLIDSCRNDTGISEAHAELVTLLKELDFQKYMEAFDKRNENNPMYKWARMYMSQVMNLLQFLRATRDSNWLLYLSSLEKMCIYFFAYNRHDYAQNIPDHLAHMYQLRKTHPAIWNAFQNGDFTITSNSTPFTSIGPDQSQEHRNRVHKGDGALSGITTSPDALLKYCLSTAELTRLSGEMEDMVGVPHQHSQKHHHQMQANTVRQERAVLKLKEVVAESNPFTVNDSEDAAEIKLVNLITNVIMPDAVQKDILNVEQRGRKALEQFVAERICGDKNLWDKLPKLKYQNWSNGSKTLKVKSGSEVLSLKATNSLFARLLIIAKSSREMDLEEIIGSYEFSTINSTLMKPDGSLHPCSDKYKITSTLEGIVPVVNEPEAQLDNHGHPLDNTSIIIDGMALVNEMIVHKDDIHNCKDMSVFFVRAVDQKSRGYCEAYVIFDDYSQTSMKDATRERRTGGKSLSQGYKVKDDTPIKDFTMFLTSKQTKDNLTLYLAQKVVNLCRVPVAVHTRKGAILSTAGSTANLICITSSQEEADTLLILYGVAVNRAGHDVHIYASDADVLILALHQTPVLGPKTVMIMGTAEHRRKVKLKPIYDMLGPQRAAALPGFLAATPQATSIERQSRQLLGSFLMQVRMS